MALSYADGSEFVTQAEAAAILGVDPRSVWRFSRAGLLPAYGRGRGLRYRRADVEKLRDSRRPVAIVSTEDAADLVGTAYVMARLGVTKRVVQRLKATGRLVPVVSSIGRNGDLYRRADVEAIADQLPAIPDDDADLVSAKEAADALGLTRDEFKVFTRVARLKPAIPGRPPVGHRYHRADVEAVRDEAATWLRLLVLRDRSDLPHGETAPELVTHAQAAKLAGLSRTAFRNRVKVGMISPMMQSGGNTWYRREDVLALGKVNTPLPATVRTCACREGCAAPVLTPGLTYAPGHGGALVGGARPGRRNKRSSPSDFIAAVREGWRLSGRNEGEFCEWIEIAPQTLKTILNGKRRQSTETIAKLNAKLQPLLGHPLPTVETANDAARKRAARTWLKTEAELSTSLDGRPAFELSDEELNARVRQWRGTAEGRAYASLRRRMATYRQKEGSAPPPDALPSQWAEDYAKELQARGIRVSVAQVIRWWRRFLASRGLRPKRGRRPLDPKIEAQRSESLHGLMRNWPWDGQDDAPHGFYVKLSTLITDLTPSSAQSWHRRHVATGCTFCLGEST